jgi:hypothetical protein
LTVTTIIALELTSRSSTATAYLAFTVVTVVTLTIRLVWSIWLVVFFEHFGVDSFGGFFGVLRIVQAAIRQIVKTGLNERPVDRVIRRYVPPV